MFSFLLAQAAPLALGHWLIIALVVAGVVGIFLVVARQAGVSVPAWVVTILWIVGAVCLGVVAIRFLLGML